MIKGENISKIYKSGIMETNALRGVSFEIKDGEFVAVMGPSGSGKSTLMHIVGALDIPSAGKYFLDGRDISQTFDDELAEIRKQKIGFVFQSFNLLSRATVLRNVMLPLIYSGIKPEERERIARNSLLSVGLEEERFSYKSNQLSGGQIQRVAIARALVNNPSIILADEPTGNLDSKTGEIVMDTFQKLNEQEGRTIVVITHESDIAEYAERIIHMKDGLIIEDNKNHKRRFSKKHENS